MTDEIPMKAIINLATGETTYEPLTAEEIAEREAAHLAAEAREAERQAAVEALQALKDSAKAKLVAGEPLTAEEAGVLVV